MALTTWPRCAAAKIGQGLQGGDARLGHLVAVGDQDGILLGQLPA